MKLQFQSIHFDADPKLLEFIQIKLNKLDTFSDRIISGNIYLKLDKGEKQGVKNKVIEAKINVPNASIFVKEMAGTFEQATDIALEALKIQLKRYKGKSQEKFATKDVVSMGDTIGL